MVVVVVVAVCGTRPRTLSKINNRAHTNKTPLTFHTNAGASQLAAAGHTAWWHVHFFNNLSVLCAVCGPKEAATHTHTHNTSAHTSQNNTHTKKKKKKRNADNTILFHNIIACRQSMRINKPFFSPRCVQSSAELMHMRGVEWSSRAREPGGNGDGDVARIPYYVSMLWALL